MNEHKERTALDSLREYAQVQLEIAKLEATGSLAGAISRTVAFLMIAFILAAGLLYLGVALALYFSELLASYTYGFLAAASLIILLGLVLFMLRKQVITGPIRNRIISSILKTDPE